MTVSCSVDTVSLPVVNQIAGHHMVKGSAFASLIVLLWTPSLSAQTIYPIDRAEILGGAQFDFRSNSPGWSIPPS